MFQVRYFLFSYLFTILIICSPSFAEVIKTKEEERAKYVMTNMQNDYITCYIFYKMIYRVCCKLIIIHYETIFCI